MYKTPLVKPKSLCKASTIYVPCRVLCDSIPQIETAGRTAKFINHPGLMPDLYKDLDDGRHTAVDKQC